MPLACIVWRVSTQRSTLFTQLLSGLHIIYLCSLCLLLIYSTCRTTSLNMRPMITPNNSDGSNFKAILFCEMLVNEWNIIFPFNTELQNRPNKISWTIKTTKVHSSTASIYYSLCNTWLKSKKEDASCSSYILNAWSTNMDIHSHYHSHLIAHYSLQNFFKKLPNLNLSMGTQNNGRPCFTTSH